MTKPQHKISHENIELLEKLIESIPVAIIIFKHDMFFACNQAYLDYIDPKIVPLCKPGLSLFDFLEKIYIQMDGVETDDSVMDELHKTDKAAWLQERLKDYRKNNTYEVLDHDGWWRIIDRYYASNNTYVGIRIDIRELKEAERKAGAADVAKSQFLANMSHEIRTPMNGILGMAEMLGRCDLPMRQKEYVEIITRSGNALMGILNDILDFSKIEAGHLQLVHAPFELRSNVEDVTALMVTRLVDAKVDLLLRVQPDLPITYFGDAGRLRQILNNLISNAVKFTEQGHVFVDISGTVEAGLARLTFSVKDTGIGIPEDKISTIFDKFSQADSSTTRVHGGTGLGLNIAREIVHLMGGDIKLHSQIGKGTRLSFSIDMPTTSDQAVSDITNKNIPGAKILIIDNSSIHRDILTEQLNYWSCKTVAVGSAVQASEVLKLAMKKRISFDLIIADYSIPGLNVEGLIRTITTNPLFQTASIIGLSARDESVLQFDNLSAIQSVPSKHLRTSLLRRTINEAFQNRPLSRPLKSTKPAEGTLGLPENTDTHVDVLVAEDNDVNQTYARFVLEDIGLSYKIVANGQQVVAAWKRLSPKVILMDISMPVQNGFEATVQIRKLETENNLPRTPIIAVTAHSLKEDEQKCLDSGMDGYLCKPMGVKQLRDCLETWSIIQSPRQQKQNQR